MGPLDGTLGDVPSSKHHIGATKRTLFAKRCILYAAKGLVPKWEDCPAPLGSSPQQLMGVELMPSPTDGSHQLPIPTDELVVGEVFLPHMPWGPAVASQGFRHLCVQLLGCGPWGVPGRASQGPCRPALRHGGEACQGSPPLTQFPGGRSPPCLTECPRSRQCPRRGRWRPRSPVLHRAPRPSTCSGK